MARAKQQELTWEEKLEQALVPEDEWPYEVPGNWVWTKLGTIAKVKGGKRLPKGHELVEYNTDNPYIRVTDFYDNSINIEKVKYILPETFNEIKNYTISSNDIYISIAGSIGKVGIIPDLLDGANLTENAAKITDIVVANQKYLMWLLQSDDMQFQMQESTIATTQAKLALFRIENMIIPLPPPAEQERIVNRIESLFTKLDQAKELAQNALDTFETRKAAILHKAFTGELTAKWREKNGVGMESWVECQLQDVCTVNPKRVDIKDIGDDVKVTFVPMPAVSEIKGAIVSQEVKTLGEVKKGYTNFSEGDVIFAKITPCMENGKSAVVEKLQNNIGFGSTEFHVLRCSEKLNNQFLYHIIRNQSFRDEAKAVMTGAVGQQRVPKAFLEEYSLHLPTLLEQQEIVRILDSLFEKEQKAKELCDVIDKIDLMKKAILARAFRGELGTNDPSEESAVELLKEVLKDK